MKEYKLPLPLKQQELIKLNNYPKNNPHKEFDPVFESQITKPLYTPLTEILDIKLMEKVVNLTNKEKEIKEKPDSASWLRKFTFEETTAENGSKAQTVPQMTKPIDYHDFFLKSFVEVEDDIEGLDCRDLVPGDKKLMLFDFDERHFQVKSIYENTPGHPTKIVIEKDGIESEYSCMANNMLDYYLIEITDDKAYYYPLEKSIKLKKCVHKTEKAQE